MEQQLFKDKYQNKVEFDRLFNLFKSMVDNAPTWNGEDDWEEFDRERDHTYWKVVYNTVFAEDFSRRMMDLFEFPDYYDPDTTYREDIMAFYEVAEQVKETTDKMGLVSLKEFYEQELKRLQE